MCVHTVSLEHHDLLTTAAEWAQNVTYRLLTTV